MCGAGRMGTRADALSYGTGGLQILGVPSITRQANCFRREIEQTITPRWVFVHARRFRRGWRQATHSHDAVALNQEDYQRRPIALSAPRPVYQP